MRMVYNTVFLYMHAPVSPGYSLNKPQARPQCVTRAHTSPSPHESKPTPLFDLLRARHKNITHSKTSAQHPFCATSAYDLLPPNTRNLLSPSLSPPLKTDYHSPGPKIKISAPSNNTGVANVHGEETDHNIAPFPSGKRTWRGDRP